MEIYAMTSRECWKEEFKRYRMYAFSPFPFLENNFTINTSNTIRSWSRSPFAPLDYGEWSEQN